MACWGLLDLAGKVLDRPFGQARVRGVGVSTNGVCGLVEDKVMCRGDIAVGHPRLRGHYAAPLTITGLSKVDAIGPNLACVRQAGGRLECGSSWEEEKSVRAFEDVGAFAGSLEGGCVARATGIGCWGNVHFGVEGAGDSFVPIAARGTGLVVGSTHACGVTEHGPACWGFYGDGALGNDRVAVDLLSPRVGTVLVDDMDVASGLACVVRSADHRVHCWGQPLAALTGVKEVYDADVLTSAAPVRQVLATAAAVCAVGEQAAIACLTEGGRLDAILLPAKPTSAKGDYDEGCALLVDQSVACWGEYFHAGHPKVAVRLKLPPISQLRAGGSYCAITTDDEHWCWGAARYKEATPTPRRLGTGKADQLVVGVHNYCIRVQKEWSCTRQKYSLSQEGVWKMLPLEPVGHLTGVLDYAPGRIELEIAGRHHAVSDCRIAADREVFCSLSVDGAGGKDVKMGISSAKELVVSAQLVCAILMDRRVACVGHQDLAGGTYSSLTTLQPLHYP